MSDNDNDDDDDDGGDDGGGDGGGDDGDDDDANEMMFVIQMLGNDVQDWWCFGNTQLVTRA